MLAKVTFAYHNNHKKHQRSDHIGCTFWQRFDPKEDLDEIPHWLALDNVQITEQDFAAIRRWVLHDHPTATSHYIDLSVFHFTNEAQIYINSYE